MRSSNIPAFQQSIIPSTGLTVDARRALWMEEWRTLVVADLHLGYEWAHRADGQMLPLTRGDDSVPRLHELLDHYAPRSLVLLGDIVHRAVALPAIKEQVCRVVSELEARTELKLVAGNHDRALDKLLRDCGLDIALCREVSVGPHLLLHGDSRRPETALARREKIVASGGTIVIGHEHPAITVSDSVATSAKVPCFALGDHLVVLPAFSHWAAGSNVRSHALSSPYARGVILTEAIAILAGKLLPIRLSAGFSRESHG